MTLSPNTETVTQAKRNLSAEHIGNLRRRLLTLQDTVAQHPVCGFGKRRRGRRNGMGFLPSKVVLVVLVMLR